MSDIKCPFCGAELQEFGGGDFPLLHYCDNINCNLYHIMGQYTLWQELICTREALDVAIDALKRIKQPTVWGSLYQEQEIATEALEQITALEPKK